MIRMPRAQRCPRHPPNEKFEAGELGFEPRLKESESFVLPLHYSPVTDAACAELSAAAGGDWRAARAMRYGTPPLGFGQYRRRLCSPRDIGSENTWDRTNE